MTTLEQMPFSNVEFADTFKAPALRASGQTRPWAKPLRVRSRSHRRDRSHPPEELITRLREGPALLRRKLDYLTASSNRLQPRSTKLGKPSNKCVATHVTKPSCPLANELRDREADC